MNDWKVIEEIFLAATERPAAEREAYLHHACNGDASLLQEVRSLLAFDSVDTRPFAPLVQAGAANYFENERMIGARFGAYQIIESLGHGGMGAVYLARRADDQFSRTAAIKFIRGGMESRGAVQRFLRERQILANLDHPYIAKLLDGGTAEDGTPYFVMDFVEGVPLDEYCDRNNLGIPARCELFRKICEAVAYAHRNLVIHRDLKPTNILVNGEGKPILLDFGIAKLLDETNSGLTAKTQGTGMLTPDYASPEQVLGRPTNTATDVYSLGVVLYQLLTGAKPFKVDSTTPLEMARTVCEVEPPRPSSLAKDRKLEGDLDNIILMALRKEPERRYASVDQFSEDILRYMKGRPVIAREDTFAYRAGKFFHRNRVWVTAGSLAAASLLSAIVLTTYEARRAGKALVLAEAQRNIAEAQREIAMEQRSRAESEHLAANEQRELATRSEQRALLKAAEAEAATQTAQKRLTDLVELGRQALFEVSGTLEHLPGALEARRDVTTTTRKYLDSLVVDAKSDPALLTMLVTGYTQTGDVLGYPGAANLGDRKGAVESWRHARQILTRIETLQPKNMRLRLQDLGLHQRIGVTLESEGNASVAMEEYRAALAIAHGLARDYPENVIAVAQTGIIEHNIGSLLASKGDPSAAEHIHAEISAYERTLSLAPDEPTNKLGLAGAINGMGNLLVSQHRLEEAIAEFRRSLAIRESVLEKRPADGGTASGIARSWLRIAATLAAPWQENLGDKPAALEACEKALTIYESLSAADPRNQKARGDLALALTYSGAIGLNTPDGLPRLRRAVSILTELRKMDPKQVNFRTDAARAHEYLGHALRDRDDMAGAIAEYRLSLEAKDNPALAAKIAESEKLILDVAARRP